MSRLCGMICEASKSACVQMQRMLQPGSDMPRLLFEKTQTSSISQNPAIDQFVFCGCVSMNIRAEAATESLWQTLQQPDTMPCEYGCSTHKQNTLDQYFLLWMCSCNLAPSSTTLLKTVPGLSTLCQDFQAPLPSSQVSIDYKGFNLQFLLLPGEINNMFRHQYSKVTVLSTVSNNPTVVPSTDVEMSRTSSQCQWTSWYIRRRIGSLLAILSTSWHKSA
ncbi:LOW QUALITY PROTEIN: hypothetical protein CVT25_006393 [Psilocybe cyanescens]|uniref:Uncharacterized protein n=1 Tax=Psilocybe cyanescens TaxID=93625 RepID=A0A409X3U5_PSICY|nr:LOW QUALITY PROTEIN: hypothetical protein CVT25_006393 [Psilocybe cyanescens]